MPPSLYVELSAVIVSVRPRASQGKAVCFVLWGEPVARASFPDCALRALAFSGGPISLLSGLGSAKGVDEQKRGRTMLAPILGPSPHLDDVFCCVNQTLCRPTSPIPPSRMRVWGLGVRVCLPQRTVSPTCTTPTLMVTALRTTRTGSRATALGQRVASYGHFM